MSTIVGLLNRLPTAVRIPDGADDLFNESAPLDEAEQERLYAEFKAENIRQNTLFSYIFFVVGIMLTIICIFIAFDVSTELKLEESTVTNPGFGSPGTYNVYLFTLIILLCSVIANGIILLRRNHLSGRALWCPLIVSSLCILLDFLLWGWSSIYAFPLNIVGMFSLLYGSVVCYLLKSMYGSDILVEDLRKSMYNFKTL